MKIRYILKQYISIFFIFTFNSLLLIENALTNSLVIEVPLTKPNEIDWRQKSNISIPQTKPDPAHFMLAIPSNVEVPKLKPDPKSVFPTATASLTEMIFKRTSIFVSSENIQSLNLRKNEGIGPLLKMAGFNSNQVYGAVSAIKNIVNLKKLPVGLKVDVLTPWNNKLGAFSFKINNEFNIYAISDNRSDWSAFKAYRPIKKETLFVAGTIKSNLYLSAQEVGLPEDALMEFVQLMGYSIDFQRQIQTGDKFKILFKQSFDVLSENRIGLEEISYAELNVSDENYKFYRFTDSEGKVGYYDEKGQSARKTLMKTPINGARLSSGFGMRKHPIKGFSAMHKGVDFGAPSGTPIFAAGDGILEKVGWLNGYGRYILIRHNSTYKTAYAHMSGWAKGIRRGARVNQGQIIGYVGSTGNSTGPHLHYEILINGKQVNPLKVRMPSGKPVNFKDKKAFLKIIQKIKQEISKLNHIN